MNAPNPRSLSVQPAALFPTRIWQARLDGLKPLFPGWVAAVEAARAASPEPAGRSNRKGWNSVEKTLLDQSGFEPLRAALTAACSHAFSQMSGGVPGFALESWANVHDRGGFNFLHMHDGCLLSGAFYLRVPEGSGALLFRDPRPGVLNAPFKGPHANGHQDIRIIPTEGLAVLFPNWLDHAVEPHQNDLSRISISFNALGVAP